MKKSLIFILALLIIISSIMYIEYCIFDFQQTKKAVENKLVVYQAELEDSEVD
jgi:uncharacterized membrane protein YidH (DUF202 family)